MQIKTIMKHYLTLVRMAIIERSTNNKCQRRCGEKSYTVGGNVNWCSHHEKQDSFLKKKKNKKQKKLKIELLYEAAIPLLSIYSDKTINKKDTHTLKFTAALLTIAKTWK